MIELTYEMISAFCSDDEQRVSLHAPFRHNDKTYATDGRRIVRTTRLFVNSDKTPCLMNAPVAVDQLDWTHANVKEWVSFDPCFLETTPHSQPCDRCAGNGCCICPHCNSDYECPKCHGDGIVAIEVCLFLPDTDAIFDSGLLHSCAVLPGAVHESYGDYKANRHSSALRFKFDLGEGLIMPMIKD